MTNRKSHTHFRLVPKSTTLGDLERSTVYAFYCRKDASFGAHHKNLNQDRPILSAAKMTLVTLVSGDIRFTRIVAVGFRGEIASNVMALSRTAIFSVFAISSETLEMRPECRHTVRRRLLSDPSLSLERRHQTTVG